MSAIEVLGISLICFVIAYKLKSTILIVLTAGMVLLSAAYMTINTHNDVNVNTVRPVSEILK